MQGHGHSRVTGGSGSVHGAKTSFGVTNVSSLRLVHVPSQWLRLLVRFVQGI
jgi:hypothetical protein